MDAWTKRLDKPMNRVNVYRMIQRRAGKTGGFVQAGVRVGCWLGALP